MSDRRPQTEVVVATFAHHADADAAVRSLAHGGIDMTHVSVVGKGYHTDEQVIGFYNARDRIKVWGKEGAFWGGLWGLFFGGVFLVVPVLGPVMVLGHLAMMIAGAAEGALLVGGFSALGAALYSIGIPEDSIVRYEETVKTDGYLILVQGSADEIARAEEILAESRPGSLDHHQASPPVRTSPRRTPSTRRIRRRNAADALHSLRGGPAPPTAGGGVMP